MMWDDGWGMHGSGSWALVVLFFAVIAPVLATFVVLWVRDHDSGGDRRPGPQNPDAEAEADRILRRRFAAGEIDEEEFLRRQAALSRDAHH